MLKLKHSQVVCGHGLRGLSVALLFASTAFAGTAHHNMDELMSGIPFPVDFPGVTSALPRGGDVTVLPEPLHVNGAYVNYETPLVDAVALSADAQTLLAVNPSNNSLVVFNTVGQLTKTAEVPVGMSPCSVAFQPGTNGDIAWVVNFMSDNVSIVDVTIGRVLDVIEVGNEPVSILFNGTGSHAFVIVQGSPTHEAGQPVVQEGALITIDTTSRTVLHQLWLDMNSPRHAVIDHALDQVIVAAKFSGNNTTVVGDPVVARSEFPNGPPQNPCDPQCAFGGEETCFFFPHLGVALLLPETANFFASPLLSPWPDDHCDPEFVDGPLVHRIVSDAGSPIDNDHPWQQIVDTLSDANGDPDPVMVQKVNDFFAIVNGEEILEEMIHDAVDTVDHDLAVIDVSNPGATAPTLLHHIGGVGTELSGLALHNGVVYVLNTEAHNLTRLETNLKGRLVDSRCSVVIGASTGSPTIAHFDLNDGIPNFHDVSGPNPVAHSLALSLPKGIAISPSGSLVVGLASGSGRIFRADPVTGAILGRVDVGELPMSLALDATGQKAYVMDRKDYSIHAVDVSNFNTMSVTESYTMFNAEPDIIPKGRPFLYSAKKSLNNNSACATCHPEAHFDGLGWDLGDHCGEPQVPPPPLLGVTSHPLKGPMVTQSLRGLENHEPFHWRGDRPLFQDFNGAFPNLLGTASEIPASEMDDFTAFIKTVQYPPAPFRNRDNTFQDPDAHNGALLFGTQAGQSCNTCHVATHGGALPSSDGDQGFVYSGTPAFAQLQLVPQNRGSNKKFRNDRYCGFGLVHDGRDKGGPTGHPLLTFLNEVFCGFSPSQMDQLVAYFEAFPTETDPVVGWQVMMTPATATHPEIDLMVARHVESDSACDVIAKGQVAGQMRGFTLIDTSPEPNFAADDGTQLSLAALLGSLTGNDSLVFTAVPPGSGARLGIDQDLDGIPDGLDPDPQAGNDGDVNLDNLFNGLDPQAFVNVILSPSPGIAPFNAADADNDGDVDIDDIDLCVDIWIQG